MVWRQCLACNRKVPGSKKACECGHVFTETKMIGRKRYSGYRAMLCSRNDPRRKTLKRKNMQPTLMLRDSKKRLSGSPKTKRKPSMTAFGEGSATKGTQKINPSDRYIMNFDSPELIEKLHDALSDINKKLAKQSLLWMVLKSSKC
ncbi:UPF0547 protein C16orf87 homolog isoform X2 [Dendronephthya gigantea]|uniref:UPF0547 protein C16orf87 homolog isoform X2 n=1 Tax=Dendronephthya gigantea TaxID=151771 RepID=UPI00106A8556|nr:UPF0547 protein C16orf87 homolog isoform X2 [Dendronephthya gigantea]